MENKKERDQSIFQQICQVNELDPTTITKEAHKRFPDKFNNNQSIEKLIWTALDHRANSLIRNVNQSADLEGDKAAYTIDADPAAPAFVVNEEYIRSQCSPETAQKIIDALEQVQLPVQP